jgi:hypothetical protein
METANIAQNQISDKSKREYIFVIFLCLIAAVRVFLFSSAFPFFNNVDEQAHFDLVYKYSLGYIPKEKVENYNRRSAELIVLYMTGEYLSNPDEFADGDIPPPIWTIPNVRKSKAFHRLVSYWQNKRNFETASFPTYYIIAGLWCAVGRAVGINGGHLLYWIRFLNIPLIVVLVYFSYLIGRTFSRDNTTKKLGLPIITAFFPQDVFYSINSDTVSSILFAISFFMLLQIHFENKSVLYYGLAGLAASVCFLAKVSNLAVLVLISAITLLKIKKSLNEKQLKIHLFKLLVLMVAVIVPISIWLMRNYLLFNDITGLAHKNEYLGWTLKPFSQLWHHPIFGIKGLLYFLREITKTFWRGEFVWYLERIFFFISGIALILNRNSSDQRTRFVLKISFCVVLISLLLMAILSTLYDFGNCWYPSSEKPYLVSGRLILCVLLPFLLIYVDGLEHILSKLKKSAAPLLGISIIAIAITISELLITWEIFASQYNWFHLK